MKEKYYICPRCKEITTETQILEECSSGSVGMCYCEFNNGRIFNKYKRISKKEYLKIYYKRLVDRLQKLYNDNKLNDRDEALITDLILFFGTSKDLNW